MTYAGIALLIASLALSAGPVLDLAAHVARYRRHRRMYPLADRGRTWKATR